MSGFSTEVLIAEDAVGEAYASTHGGLLPNTPFWTLATQHALQDFQTTGNLNRFAENHGWTMAELEQVNIFEMGQPAHPLAPIILTAPPPPGSTYHTEYGAVLEPSSHLLLGVGLLIAWLIRPVFLRVLRPGGAR